MYKEFGISEKLEEIAISSEKELIEVFSKIQEDALYNSQRVLTAFQKNNVSEMQFISGTHALTVALFGLLRPNDIMLAISRKAI